MRPVVRWLPEAWERYATLTADQQAQARRLLTALLISPQAGRFWHTDATGHPIWFVSAVDTHVVYRVLWYRRNTTIYVLDVLVFPYTSEEEQPAQ